MCCPVLTTNAGIDGSEERLGLVTCRTTDAGELPLLLFTLMGSCTAKILDIDPFAIGHTERHAHATASHMAQTPGIEVISHLITIVLVISESLLDSRLIVKIEVGAVVATHLVEGREANSVSKVALPVPAATLADQIGIGLRQRADQRPHGSAELDLLLLALLAGQVLVRCITGDTGCLAEGSSAIMMDAVLVVSVFARGGGNELLLEVGRDCTSTKSLVSCFQEEDEEKEAVKLTL